MNRELAYAFTQLRVSERQAVLQDLNLNMSHSSHESSLDFIFRVLQKVSCEGLVRELENAMRRFQ
jgi:ACT domain-containing protein